MKFILKKMKKWNTFYLLLVVVLAIVILKTSCMEDQKQDEATLKSKAVLENISERKSVRKYLSKSVEEDKIDAMLKAGTWIARRQRRTYCWQLRLWGLVLCGRRLILMKIELMLYDRIRDYQRI